MFVPQGIDSFLSATCEHPANLILSWGLKSTLLAHFKFLFRGGLVVVEVGLVSQCCNPFPLGISDEHLAHLQI